MSKSTYSFEIDDNLRTRFDDLCEEFGMDGATAFNKFANAVVEEQRIPFDIGKNRRRPLEKARRSFYNIRRQVKENGMQDMSLDEINEEIRKVRYGID